MKTECSEKNESLSLSVSFTYKSSSFTKYNSFGMSRKLKYQLSHQVTISHWYLSLAYALISCLKQDGFSSSPLLTWKTTVRSVPNRFLWKMWIIARSSEIKPSLFDQNIDKNPSSLVNIQCFYLKKNVAAHWLLFHWIYGLSQFSLTLLRINVVSDVTFCPSKNPAKK